MFGNQLQLHHKQIYNISYVFYTGFPVAYHKVCAHMKAEGPRQWLFRYLGVVVMNNHGI